MKVSHNLGPRTKLERQTGVQWLAFFGESNRKDAAVLGLEGAPVKLEEKCWFALFLLLIVCPPVLPQTVSVADDENSGSAGISWTGKQERVGPLQLAIDNQASPPPLQTSAEPKQKPYGWNIAIYPALACAAIFGTSVTLPPSPPHPGQPIVTPSGSTDSSLNGAFFGDAFRKG
jgi:hypothetical protein